jgi:hypothetical protein
MQKFCVLNFILQAYLIPCNTFMRKEKDPEPDLYLWLMDPYPAPDPTPFFSDFKDEIKIHIFLLITYPQALYLRS